MRMEFTRRSLAPREDAAETVATLRARGYKVGLISDCSVEVPALWQETRLAPLVDAPVFSCVVGLRKPDPGIYAIVCERLGVPAGACLYVGDGSSHELTGARTAGMDPVLIVRNGPLGETQEFC